MPLDSDICVKCKQPVKPTVSCGVCKQHYHPSCARDYIKNKPLTHCCRKYLGHLLLSLDPPSATTRSRVNSLKSTKTSTSSVSSFKSVYSPSPPVSKSSIATPKSLKSPITPYMSLTPGDDSVFPSPAAFSPAALLPQGWSEKSLDEKVTALMEKLLVTELNTNQQFGNLRTQITELKDEQSKTTNKLNTLSTNVEVNANSIATIDGELANLRTRMEADKASILEKLSALENTNSAGGAATVSTAPIVTQSSAELVISGIPDPFIKEMSPIDISKAVLNHLKLPQLINDVLNIRKFEPKSRRNPSSTGNKDTSNSHSLLVCLKLPQIRDYIVDTKRKIKLLPVKTIYPGIVNNNVSGNIYINEFLLPDTYKLLMRTKEKAKTMNFKYAWARSGQIFVKKDDYSDRLGITCTSDLSKLE